MRVIEVFDEPVRAITVSPDGRWLGVTKGPGTLPFNRWTGETSDFSGGSKIALVDRQTCEIIHRLDWVSPVHQLAFTSDGQAVVFAHAHGLFRLETTGGRKPFCVGSEAYAGGVAISPDGRTLVAPRGRRYQDVPLDRWDLPTWRPVSGFNCWSAFPRLAFSPNGEFLAGIDPGTFELRIAVTGGINGRQRVRDQFEGLMAFARDSQSVVFGWGADLHIMETRGGAVVQRIASPGEAFADATFLGSGQLLASVDRTAVLRLWSVETWKVVREYDWGVGGLTCLTATIDGLTGLCGTDAGRVVVFDVDD